MRRGGLTLDSFRRHQVLPKYKACLATLHVRVHNYSLVNLPRIYVRCEAQL